MTHGDATWPRLAVGARAVADILPTASLGAVPGENHSTTADVLADAHGTFVRES
ncbi:hypothetical protein K0817_010000 [Microbacterium sp. HD4P20]|uniref:hypothetical protein n=1 Tax=Microbacterium sp. HD4P20 TaxID=2864874 RepID=UPI001C63E47A|nr:hypothetical protein [Microbacterium sp. HD4P20]MCP2636892.1 hypothetical protein [Microbacterium sp. HD4P20]